MQHAVPVSTFAVPVQPPTPVGAEPTLRWRVWVPAVVGVPAFLCRIIPVLPGGGLFGVDTYDPSVYSTATVGLFTGCLPYRDFLLLHPPGILLVLQPFAALGALVGDPVAMATARVGFMVLGVVSTLLVYREPPADTATPPWSTRAPTRGGTRRSTPNAASDSKPWPPSSYSWESCGSSAGSPPTNRSAQQPNHRRSNAENH